MSAVARSGGATAGARTDTEVAAPTDTKREADERSAQLVDEARGAANQIADAHPPTKLAPRTQARCAGSKAARPSARNEGAKQAIPDDCRRMLWSR